MTRKLIKLKKDYYNYLDRKARHTAYILSKSKAVTKHILSDIQELYESAKLDYLNNDKFESAYHNPITSELEFLMARILYHYSNFKGLDWKIYLRRQKGQQKRTKKNNKLTAPDIRIEKNKNTLAIIEVKAKAGWIQPFFSNYLIKKYKREGNVSKIKDCKDRIKKQREQLKKYSNSFEIQPNRVFVLLSTLEGVSRPTKSSMNIEDHYNQFSKNSGLPKENLILLSNNPILDLSSSPKRIEYQPTNRFEKFVSLLDRLSK